MAVDQGYLAALRAEIDKRMGWTPREDVAVAWDHAVTTALAVVGPLLEDRGRVAYLEARIGELQQQIADLRTGMRVAEQECICDIELMMWLHAEALWQRDQAVMEEACRWRKIVDQWERGHQNEVLPYTAKLEAERDMLAWLHAEAAWWLQLSRDEHEVDAVLDHWSKRVAYLEARLVGAKKEIGRLRREVEFEALGANSFSGAEARVVEGGDTP